jgi:hypothetical protein
MIGSHVIPKFYLEQFATKKSPKAKAGHLWVYTKNAPVRQGTPKSEGVENGYFGMPMKEGLDESLEAELAEREDRAKDVLLMAPNETFIWSASYRNIMADYVSLIYARTKVRRDATGWVSQSVSTDLKRVIDDELFMREMADDYAALYKRPVDIPVLKDSLRRAAEKTVEDEEKRRFFLSQMFDTAKLVCNKVLLQRAWQVWEAPIHQQFITSDNPVITMLPVNGDFAPGFGFNAAGVLVAFPLNWKSCLIVGRNQNSFRTADSQEVERANEIQIRSMLYNVYSHRGITPPPQKA